MYHTGEPLTTLYYHTHTHFHNTHTHPPTHPHTHPHTQFIIYKVLQIITFGQIYRVFKLCKPKVDERWIHYPNRDWNPPFTREYMQQMDPFEPEQLSAMKIREGWEFV